MELQAKETRLIIQGLEMLLQSTMQQMKSLDDEDSERAFLSNDAVLIDTMIAGFQAQYQEKFESTDI